MIVIYLKHGLKNSEILNKSNEREIIKIKINSKPAQNPINIFGKTSKTIVETIKTNK